MNYIENPYNLDKERVPERAAEFNSEQAAFLDALAELELARMVLDEYDLPTEAKAELSLRLDVIESHLRKM